MNQPQNDQNLGSRRKFLSAAAAAGTGALLPASGAFGARAKVKEKTADELMTPGTHAAIDKGLRYLAGRQISRGGDRGAFGSGGYAGSVGICGLAGLAFMSEGSTPGVLPSLMKAKPARPQMPTLPA